MSTPIYPLSQCATVAPGYSPKGALVHDPEGTHQIVMAKHLVPGEPYRFSREHDELRILPPGKPERYLVASGDILFMAKGASNYPVLIETVPPTTIASSTFYILRVHEGVDPVYLTWCLGQQPLLNYLAEIRTGSGMPMIPREEFKGAPVPLPPLETQRQIARLATLQTREIALRRQLLNETERLHSAIGRKIFDSFSDSK